MPDKPDENAEDASSEYGPPDEPMTYDETGDEAGRGRMVLLLAVVFVVAAAALLYVVFQQGVRTGGRNAPPVIVAETAPEKVKPQDPGGMEVPHQDKTVYDRVSGEDAQRVERLLPEPEEPIDVSGLRSGTEPEDGAAMMLSPDEPVEEAPDGETVTVPAGTGPGTETGTVIKAVPVPEPRPEVVPELAVPEPTEFVDIGALAETLSASAQREAAADPIGNSVSDVDEGSVNRVSGTIAAATSGAYVVQVASFKGADLATGGWEDLTRKNKDLLAQLRPDIQLADLGERGVYYRLRIGPFATKADAQALCNKLKERRQDCLVRPT